MKKPSRAIKLVGTEAADPKARTLRAGALSAEFGNGAAAGDIEQGLIDGEAGAPAE